MASYSGQTLINTALENLGILDIGGVASVSDSNKGLSLLNLMIQQFRLQNKLIWSIGTALWPLQANVGSYTIGTGGTFNGPRPTFIEEAYVSFVGPGGSIITSELEIITAKRFGDLADLSATAELPEMLYNDRASPLSKLYLYPKPRVNVASNLELFTWAQLSDFADLTTTYDLPDGYPEAIANALAFRFVPVYGVAVNAQVVETVKAIALQAEANIAALNIQTRQLMAAAGGPPAPAPAAAQ